MAHHRIAKRILLVITVCGGCLTAGADENDATTPSPPSFEQDIRPLLASACFDCHGEDTQEAQLDLRTVTSILQGGDNGHGLVRGEPDRSLLLDMLD